MPRKYAFVTAQIYSFEIKFDRDGNTIYFKCLNPIRRLMLKDPRLSRTSELKDKRNERNSERK